MINLDQFYKEIVSPFIREFEDDRASLKSAYGAIWALDSYASHIFYALKDSADLKHKNDIEYKRDALRPISDDFDTIVEVSNAMKHAVRDRVGTVSSSIEIISINLEGWSAYFAGPDADKWGAQVIVHNADRHLFSPLLPKVQRTEIFLHEVIASFE